MNYNSLKISTAACVAVLLLAGGQRIIAQPTPITSANPDFQDTAGNNSTRLNVGGADSITGTFNIESDTGSITIGSDFSDAGTVYHDETGFNPLVETAVSGTMNFWLKTTTGDTAEFTVNIDNPTTGSILGPDNGKIQYDFGSGSLSGTAIASLNSDGELSYTISNGGRGDGYTDFYVEDVVLQVDTSPLSLDGGNPVPDSSSTALLLAAVLSGFWMVKRRMTHSLQPQTITVRKRRGILGRKGKESDGNFGRVNLKSDRLL